MSSSYTSKSITRLDPVERVRRFPARFLGEEVWTTAAREIIDNACDEVAKGHATSVGVTFHDDGSIEVSDNGRGVPVDFDADFLNEDGTRGANGVVKALGTLGAGSNYGDGGSGGGAGVHGEGGAATNAVSRRFDVTVWRDGKRYHQGFKNGIAGTWDSDTFDPEAGFTPGSGRLKGTPADKDAPAHGTSVRFQLDTDLAPDVDLDIDGLITRTQLVARLRDGMKLTITRAGETDTFTGPTYGAGAALELMAGQPPQITVNGDVIFTRQGRTRHASVQVALAPSDTPTVTTAANSVWTPDGGSYQNALLRAVGEGLAARRVRGLELKTGEAYPQAEDFAAVTSMLGAVTFHDAPARFTGQDKAALAHEKSLNHALEAEVSRQVGLWASSSQNTAVLTRWAKLAVEHARTTRKIAEAKAASKKKSSAARGTNLALPDKYVPCHHTGRGSGAELHICEGDSALGTIKNSRDARFQAAYPLRGKPVRSYGQTLTRMRKNGEFSAIETLLGCGAGEACDPEDCRFDRIMLTCDADVDGYNIEASVAVMLTEFFRPLVEAGMVYIPTPPLFIVTAGSERIYCVDEQERDQAQTALVEAGKKPQTQRCKGLGEMSPHDFWDTVMDPAARTLYRLVYDPEKDGPTVEVVFGNSASDRREWMAQMAAAVNADDVMA